MTTTAPTAMPFTVLSGDRKAGPLKLGNRSPSWAALLGFYAELERIAQAKAPGNGAEGETTCHKD